MSILEQQWQGIIEMLLGEGILHQHISSAESETATADYDGTMMIWTLDKVNGTITFAKA